ncbi:MAG: 30S ribosomal protein S1 [Verrucomicrobia bacterium]|nr:30S ribosomal protein S1 [Verrucomicrobiota bacterium]MCH8526515.1 30S ribosomal protein S1 [Kiritimatiellia bacterium]
MYDESLKEFNEGSIIEGIILAIRSNDVLVDVGYKSEGIIPKNEFKKIEELSEGDKIEVLLERLEDDNGMVVLSKQRAETQKNWDRILETYSEGDLIEGVVHGRVKGGMLVDVGVEAFLPGSQIDLVPVKDPDVYIGQVIQFKIIKINLERRNIVVSRRELLEEQRREMKAQLLGEIKIGQQRKGVVKNITDFGAFIDLSGMDGLLHITDMSWGRINHPSEMVKIGDELEVTILDVDYEKERVSLGLKQQSDNPWEEIGAKYPVGHRIRGKVVNLMPYGAFVELEPGVEGLVHVSELSWTKRIARASDVLNVGDEVDAMVLAVNKDDKKISLGIRQTEENPWEIVANKYPIGSRIVGTVRNFTNYGAFLELEEGVDGMVHVSDMSWTRKVNHPSEVLEKGQKVDAVVLEVDASNQRISLGMKQAMPDPWSSVASKYAIGQLVEGKVAKLAQFGAFVELEEGIEGLVHISQISDERVEKVKDVLKVGDEVKARIVKMDEVDRRIGLSIKAAEVSDDEFQLDDSMLEGLRPGEDMVDLGSAFDDAFSGLEGLEEWHPGDK